MLWSVTKEWTGIQSLHCDPRSNSIHIYWRLASFFLIDKIQSGLLQLLSGHSPSKVLSSDKKNGPELNSLQYHPSSIISKRRKSVLCTIRLLESLNPHSGVGNQGRRSWVRRIHICAPNTVRWEYFKWSCKTFQQDQYRLKKHDLEVPYMFSTWHRIHQLGSL